ncbi:uncharacterized protein LOC106143271 [Amyelois transitella]|uniref:uncharacterized protein LOC106143271 n=1 Tax=Amyelois transitella TaxID=680683 RepID=UPI00067C4DAF|nr:uncharacterized protein LOC106143271 [Amyelois transitella]
MLPLLTLLPFTFLLLLIAPSLVLFSNNSSTNHNTKISFNSKMIKEIPSNDTCVDNLSPAEDCFQHFKLAIIWSPGYAYKQKVENNAQIKKINTKPEWIIHGFWPSMNNRTDVPEKCGTTDNKFDANGLKTNGLMDELEECWYSILENKTNIQSWEDEFENHGSCATRADPIRDDVDYFRKTIELFYNVNLGGKLTSGEFKPGDVRKLKDVKNIINKQIGAEVEVNTFKYKNRLILTEVYVCYNLALDMINCPNTNSPQDDLENYVIYSADFQ